MVGRKMVEEAEKIERRYSINEIRSKLSDRGVDYNKSDNKRRLADKLARYNVSRRRRNRSGSDVQKLDDVMINDTLRNKWGQKWKAREFVREGLLVERLDRNGSPTGETKVIRTLGERSVRTPGDTKRHWDDYEKEGGHHIM